jgi:succinoglycan biosynthesis transport protein ExoP
VRGRLELNDVLRAVRTQHRLLVGGVALGLLVAALLTWLTPKSYESTTRLWVTTAGNPANPSDPYNSDQFAQSRIVSYVQVLTSLEFAQTVISDADLPITPAEFADEVSVTPLPDTVVLEVTVDDPTPQRAQQIAVAVDRSFTAYVTALETPDGAAASNVKVATIQDATFEPDAVSPNAARNLALGAALGLVLGFAIALLRVRTDRSVRSDAHVRTATGVAPIGWVPEDRHLHRSPIAVHGSSAAAEGFRALRLTLQQGSPTTRVVVLTSALPGEGTSTVAVNLAVSLARSGRRVALVEGNVRRPRLARFLELPEDRPGLTDVLAGKVEVRAALQPWRDDRLVLLGAGPVPSDVDELFSSPAMRSVVTTLRDTFDVVIVDAPPLLSVVDGATLATLADGTVLVTRYGKTSQRDLEESASVLALVRARVLGVVLTHLPHNVGKAHPAGGRAYAKDSVRRPVAGQARPASDGLAPPSPGVFMPGEVVEPESTSRPMGGRSAR